MPDTLNFATADKLVYRVKRALQKGQRISFLLGSGLSMPCEGFRGIPNTNKIIEIISERLSDDDGTKIFSDAISGHKGADAYQAAMNILVQCEGQAALNTVIAEAVLEARQSEPSTSYADRELEILENDWDGWSINSGVTGIAQLFNLFPDAIGPILTSNFDPLLGIAIKKLGGQVQVLPILEDGALSQLPTSGPQRQIIHFHGYWRGTDTLHTSQQITRLRPRLGGELRRILEETTLVVLGYGGWSDVFMNTLYSIISEGAVKSNVLWGFFSDNVDQITDEHSVLLSKLAPQIGTRVILYRGVDTNLIVPQIFAGATQGIKSQQSSDINQASPRTTRKKASTFADPGCDIPPAREYWTGRSNELSALYSPTYRVAFITGIGGQGKSCLAAEFVRTAAVESEIFEFWDWRDCREEANRMHTNLASICYRLADGGISMEDLKEETEDSLIEHLFQFLGDRSALFIFDNVDEYIDLKLLAPDRAVRKLTMTALSRNHNAKFLFTCRPYINLVDPRSQQLAIVGFSTSESHTLFRQYPIKCGDTELNQLSNRANRLTNGHPLWLNIIAAQAVIGPSSAVSFMDAVERGESPASTNQSDILASQTLGAVWQRLNEKQKILLRGMSEAVRQFTEQELVAIMAEKLNYNGLSKSLKKLRSLNLVVTRRSDQNVDSFDLHPLVRRFVRTRYSPEEQRQYIQLFIIYFDGLISKIKSQLGTRTSFSDFSNWSYKIELELNRNNPEDALGSLQEVSNQMIEAGYIEEYVRLTELVYSRLDWQHAVSENLHSFTKGVCVTAEILVQLGRYEQADRYFNHLQSEIHSAGIAYLELCNARAFRFWHQDQFTEAIIEARRAVALKVNSGADVKIEPETNLALALRDSRIAANVEEALVHFLEGSSLKNILSEASDMKIRPMSFYGNIGRCLQFLSRNNEAIECYRKSLQIAQSRDGYSIIRNTGYAYWWIGEIFASGQETNTAAHFYKFAQNVWQKTCPPRARKMSALLDQLLIIEPSLESVMLKSELEISSYCVARIGK